jgi:dipeptidyl aminopeptidase/acylaminoacyl peptidase
VGLTLSEVSSIIDRVTAVPVYVVYGVAKGGSLVYGSSSEGTFDLYSLDVPPRVRRVLARSIHFLATARPSSDYVVYVRDVSRGFELSRVYTVPASGGEVVDVSSSLPPQRVLGLAFDGQRVVWTGATREYAGIFLAKLGSEPELVARVSGREYTTDVSDRYVVGYGHLRGDPFSTELFVVDLSRGGELRVYTPREGSTNVAPRLRGSKAIFASDFEDGDRQRLYVLDLESGELSRVQTSWRDMELFDPVEFVDYGWTDDGLVWAIAKRDGRAHLYVDGRLVGFDTGFVSSAVLHGGRAYVVHSTLKTPPKVLSVDLVGLSYEVLEGVDLPEDISRRLGDVYLAEVRSFDGVRVPTYVLESAVAPKPGPTVVYPHGGPWAEVADSWSPIIVTLAALGYHVVAPNFRGSTGYGQRFRKMDIGDPGGADMEDVAAARNWAVERGLASGDSVAVVGYSYGGYTTLVQLTRKPNLWRCGVAGAPVADWEEMYELADTFFKRFEEILFAGKRELFRERSPINYVENVVAPLCIVQPQNDSRTPLKPVMRFVQRLAELGKTFEFHVIPDIGHAISLERSSLAKFLLYTALFLGKYLQTSRPS